MIDLTQPLSATAPTWDGTCGFCLRVKSEGLFQVQEVAMDNVGDCSSMPREGGYVASLPLRCDGATESPIRMVGLVERAHQFER